MIKLKTLTKTEQRALEEFKEKILRKFKGKVFLIKLFGSKARGDSWKGSDMDILLVLKKKIHLADKESDFLAKLVFKILMKYNVYISVTDFSLKEYLSYSKMGLPFLFWVNKEGINIWKKDLLLKVS